MAAVSLTHHECMDDSDEGFEQGDCPLGFPEDDASLPPLVRLQKYAQSLNIFHRQMVIRMVQDFFRTVPADLLTQDLPEIMKIVTSIGDETVLRADLLEQIPQIAAQAVESSSRVSALKNVVGEYLIPLVVRNLGYSDNAVDKAAHATLINLVEQGFISKQQAEIQVCPSILALSKVTTTADIQIGAIQLMSKLAPFLGRDVTERVFLKRFTELCTSPMFYVRKVCASHFGEFCSVIGKDAFENSLLPCYIALCSDEVWSVRKGCAEVVMFLSCACSPEMRKDVLAPVFARLLQDVCRWVKMAAFQALGPFISTFADPTITNVGYNQGGELVLVNGDGGEFSMYGSKTLNISDRYSMYLDENKDTGHDIFGIGISNEQQDEDNNENKTTATTTDTKNSTNNVINMEKHCDNLENDEEKINNCELENDMAKLSIGDNNEEQSNSNDNQTLTHNNNNKCLDNAINNKNVGENSKGENISLASNSSTTIITSTADEDTTKVNVNGANAIVLNEDDNNCDEDDLHLFNSYNYWYISPELPLDVNIVTGTTTPPTATDVVDHNKSDVAGYGDVAAHLQKIYAKVSLNESLQENDQSVNTTVTLSDSCNNIEEITEKEDESSTPEPPQKIVPQYLIDHYVSMTDPNLLLNIDNEMTYHCAYSLPAVALTLGSDNWHLLKSTIETLAGAMQYKVRRTVASGLHELAHILGPEIATNDLTPLFDGFIKDLDEVRIGILKHLAQFLKLIHTSKRNMYLPRLVDFLQTDNEWNWRFRQELAQQLLEIVPLLNANDTAKYLGAFAIILLCDQIAAIRQVALSLICEVIKHTNSDHGLTSSLLIKLADNFAHSKKWKRRQTFCLLCIELLKEKAVECEQFASDVMPHLLDLSWDPVANVRLVVARCLSCHIMNNEYFNDPENENCAGLETVLKRLQADKDRDVRQLAEL